MWVPVSSAVRDYKRIHRAYCKDILGHFETAGEIGEAGNAGIDAAFRFSRTFITCAEHMQQCRVGDHTGIVGERIGAVIIFDTCSIRMVLHADMVALVIGIRFREEGSEAGGTDAGAPGSSLTGEMRIAGSCSHRAHDGGMRRNAGICQWSGKKAAPEIDIGGIWFAFFETEHQVAAIEVGLLVMYGVQLVDGGIEADDGELFFWDPGFVDIPDKTFLYQWQRSFREALSTVRPVRGSCLDTG